MGRGGVGRINLVPRRGVGVWRGNIVVGCWDLLGDACVVALISTKAVLPSSVRDVSFLILHRRWCFLTCLQLDKNPPFSFY